MSDVLIAYLRQTLPAELVTCLSQHLSWLEEGQFQSIIESSEAIELLARANDGLQAASSGGAQASWNDLVFDRLGSLLSTRDHNTSNVEESPACKQHVYFIIGLAAFYSFLQSNVTGPPLQLDILPGDSSSDKKFHEQNRRDLILGLSLDGEAAYGLTPNVELLCLAQTILSSPPVAKNVRAASWARLRVDFWHQKLLSEPSPTLQKMIFSRLDDLENELSAVGDKSIWVHFLLEKAVIHTHHGFHKLAREDLDAAAKARRFQFALTGRMGKRTKFQQKDTSQLVVLARSNDDTAVSNSGSNGTASTAHADGKKAAEGSRPQALDLNDDTLLESISFTKPTGTQMEFVDDESLPDGLRNLDPEKQPRLDALDSIILMSLASSITNTSPEDGLTREETAPYATRVLEGGSSNWQVYTQALLLRSRVEGYKSRTVERGLLQLQTVVDQVIAETTTGAPTNGHDANSSTFLPPLKASESAPVAERLRYVCQLPSQSRWELEAELASRWVNLGGLRSASEIYERLEMWPEAALCWAATEREDKAKNIVRRQLFHAISGNDAEAQDDEKWGGPAREPPPSDAPRLYCILGDIDKDPAMYEKAWEVSNKRYARAQRSLGRLHFAAQDHVKAAHAYAQAVQVNPTNQTSWFALGCALLELQEYQRAAEAFSRTVQLDDTDAEAWSNLAVCLMNIDPTSDPSRPPPTLLDDDEEAPITSNTSQPPPDKSHRDALRAFKRAATLKHDNHRIWENVLTTSVSLSPPSFPDILTALTRLIDLRGPTVGEQCIDAPILDLLVRHIITTSLEAGQTNYDPASSGLARMTVELVDTKVTPLITASSALWKIVSRLALFRRRPTSALEAEEKAWRCVTSQPGWEYGTEEQCNKVVDATVELVDAYRSLGEMARTEGLGAGEGNVVAKDWRFKARSAVKGIIGRGKDGWEGTDGWERLKECSADLKG